MATIAGTDPRTGTTLDPVADTTTPEQVDQLATAAAAAFTELRRLGRGFRAELLDALAAAVESRRDDLIATASRETGFNDTKLGGELTRTVFQFRFFADVVRDGGYLEATIDPAADTGMGPRPDLRRLLVPVGPVAVFGASNFPFAFSVLGGDTASAVAAGSPVIVKAHGSHPATSLLSFEILRDAATAAGAPAGTFGIVFGTQGGADLVAHEAITAVGFTGSLSGGKALLEIINARPEPIPFYGELSSINPVIVTAAAAAERGEDIGRGLIASITVGSGQLCTKPGLVLVPTGPDGDRLVAAARAAVAEVPAQILLNKRIFDSYTTDTDTLGTRGEITHATAGHPAEAGYAVASKLFETDVDDLTTGLVDEIFGPVTVVVRYDAGSATKDVTRALDTLHHALTATLHIGSGETELAGQLLAVVEPRAGRVIFNGFPTGVAVSWAQTHGGPWPSTNSIHTSVGATAIRRFLRPVTFQDAPEAVLPEELRDGFTQIPRRIDGVLQAAH
ncbi:aldehyde dehydrogenase (NADP(+)) [Rhodococcus sp. NPDC057529]|uniref:aldehyde dehydrogenase (NADP(+)) n=1 Tax=Rhodococcus sp. NPDC057529 TaxID=3346158 RepID=UPI00367318EA